MPLQRLRTFNLTVEKTTEVDGGPGVVTVPPTSLSVMVMVVADVSTVAVVAVLGTVSVETMGEMWRNEEQKGDAELTLCSAPTTTSISWHSGLRA